MIKQVFTFLFLFFVISLHAGQVNIIPKPTEMSCGDAYLQFNEKSAIIYSSQQVKEQAEILATLLRNSTNLPFEVKSGLKALKNSILLSLDESVESEEGYLLSVTEKGAVVKASSVKGIFYGTQSLLQLFPENVVSQSTQRGVEWRIPTVEIVDAPTFAWRGMMLDVSRYFLPMDYVKRYVEVMAMYKMNSLHLHLVDDSGWRMESKKYPLLTEIGAFRGEGEQRTGGFYTQEELRELVHFAEQRGVTIIPEVEFPAHILSAVVAYPWLSCREEQLKMPLQHYISRDLICVGKESSIQFLQDIIDEVVEIFPSKYIHIGGDEAVYKYWDECPKCQKVMKDNNFTKSSELQSYLTNIVAKMAAKYDRTVVGWDEILERGEVTEKVVSMIWRDMKGTDHVLELGHSAVLAPADYTYFDFPESRLPGEIKAATWKGPISVEKCYNFDVSRFEGNPNILGVHGCMWTDQFIHGTILQELDPLNENRAENYVDYLTLPRLLALSEVAWSSSKNRDFKDFSSRLVKHYKRLDMSGYNYRIPVPDVASTERVKDGYLVELSTPVEGATIHYTTTGERATPYDKLYSGKVKVAQLSDLRAVAALSKSHFSISSYFEEDYSKYKPYGSFVVKLQHALLASGDGVEVVDLTGKVSGDGDYEISFIPLTDGVDIEIGAVDIYKRDEKSTSVNVDKAINSDIVTATFSLSGWEAGTPFSAKVEMKAGSANRGNIAIFLKKR